MKCQHCDKICKNLNSLRQHEIRCKMNINRLEFTEAQLGAAAKSKGRKGTNQYTYAKRMGLDAPIVSEETRKKISIGSKKYNAHCWTEEKRKKHSDIMKKIILDNPDSYSKNNVCGRVKIIEHNGTKLKGTWEVKVAKWLDEHKIKWENEVNPQKYIWNGNEHTYFPDFYLPEFDTYIEVKGYKTDRDEAKWNSFSGVLKVIDHSLIHKLYKITPLELLGL